MIPAISIVLGLILTSLIWKAVAPGLNRGHQKMNQLIDQMDDRDAKAVRFMRPPNIMQNGVAGQILQFILILLPVTGLIYYLLTRI